jgi:NAD(P)-dependent dehydrogenase (short-subunit alcohol dehydrogenase family)
MSDGAALREPGDNAGQSGAYPSLAGRLVLITGGASGIGEAFVEAFLLQQARVVFLDIDATAAAALIARLTPAARASPAFYPCDLTDSAALAATMDELLAAHGPVDILINNAANDGRHAFEEVTPEFWDRCVAVNLKHQFFVTQAVVPGMKRQSRGVVLNMSSISWMIPAPDLSVYAASKAATVGLTRTLAHTLGPHGIRVNCILPGAIATERQKRMYHTPETETWLFQRQALKRLIQPEDVARLALFLAADDSSAITNQSFIIDGGWT